MSEQNTLTTKRLQLDWLTMDDAPLMLSIWNDPAFMRNVGDRGVRDLSEARESMRDTVMKLYADEGYGPYRLKHLKDGKALGICGLFKRGNLMEPDIGFALLPSFYRRGYAGEAARAVLEHARTKLNLSTISAIVDPRNRPSIRLLENLGFCHSGDYQLPGDKQRLNYYLLSFD